MLSRVKFEEGISIYKYFSNIKTSDCKRMADKEILVDITPDNNEPSPERKISDLNSDTLKKRCDNIEQPENDDVEIAGSESVKVEQPENNCGEVEIARSESVQEMKFILDESFDLDVFSPPRSERSSSGGCNDEEEIFIGPVGYREKCRVAAVIEEEHKNKPLSPLTAEQMAHICKEANLVAYRIEAANSKSPRPSRSGVLRSKTFKVLRPGTNINNLPSPDSLNLENKPPVIEDIHINSLEITSNNRTVTHNSDEKLEENKKKVPEAEKTVTRLANRKSLPAGGIAYSQPKIVKKQHTPSSAAQVAKVPILRSSGLKAPNKMLPTKTSTCAVKKPDVAKDNVSLSKTQTLKLIPPNRRSSCTSSLPVTANTQNLSFTKSVKELTDTAGPNSKFGAGSAKNNVMSKRGSDLNSSSSSTGSLKSNLPIKQVDASKTLKIPMLSNSVRGLATTRTKIQGVAQVGSGLRGPMKATLNPSQPVKMEVVNTTVVKPVAVDNRTTSQELCPVFDSPDCNTQSDLVPVEGAPPRPSRQINSTPVNHDRPMQPKRLMSCSSPQSFPSDGSLSSTCATPSSGVKRRSFLPTPKKSQKSSGSSISSQNSLRSSSAASVDSPLVTSSSGSNV